MDMEIMKQKYPKLWNECQNDEELFTKLVKLKEREKQLREQLNAKSEREKKREARALIILSKILIKEHPELVNHIIENYRTEFQQKEGREELDYSTYIKKFLHNNIASKQTL